MKLINEKIHGYIKTDVDGSTTGFYLLMLASCILNFIAICILTFLVRR